MNIKLLEGLFLELPKSSLTVYRQDGLLFFIRYNNFVSSVSNTIGYPVSVCVGHKQTPHVTCPQTWGADWVSGESSPLGQRAL